jgi:glycosyltransferase involved in cell wall biosynthesis
MKVRFLSHSDGNSGAAAACRRLAHGLRAQNVDCTLQVEVKTGDEEWIYPLRSKSGLATIESASAPILDRLPLLWSNRPDRTWSSNRWPQLFQAPIAQDADIVHFHWIGNGAIPLSAFKGLGVPVVTTLHDPWLATGGCHYPGQCERFTQKCGQCPAINSLSSSDWSSSNWRAKAEAIANLDLTLICPTTWMQEIASRSLLLRHLPSKVIPNGIDTDAFRPIERAVARRILGIEGDCNWIFFSAGSQADAIRKGYHHLLRALDQFSTETKNGIGLLIAGFIPDKLPIVRFHCLGMLRDEVSMRLALSASQVVAIPSLQDNLPNLLLEAASSGIPVVANDVGGISEGMVIGGHLVEAGNPSAFAKALLSSLNDGKDTTLASEIRKEAILRFDIGTVARKHFDHYQCCLH